MRGARGCPPGETWVDAAAGEAPLREELLDHLAACPDCAAELRALRELRGWAQAVEATTQRPRVVASGPPRVLPMPRDGRRGPRPLRLAAAIAALLLLPLGALLLWRPVSPEPAPQRGRLAPQERVEPADGSLLDAAPQRFAWGATRGARHYRVLLLDAEGTLVWTSDVSIHPEVALPATVRARLRPGGTYFWRVSALLDGDTRISPAYELRLR